MDLNVWCCKSYGKFAGRNQGWDWSGFTAGEVFGAVVAGGALPVVQNLHNKSVALVSVQSEKRYLRLSQ